MVQMQMLAAGDYRASAGADADAGVCDCADADAGAGAGVGEGVGVGVTQTFQQSQPPATAMTTLISRRGGRDPIKEP